MYLLFIVIIVLLFIESNNMPIGNSPRLITKVYIPPLYYQISNTSGNFSTLTLPVVLSNSSDPFFYSSQAQFYTSITRKPILSGFTSRENLSSSASPYNIPLVTQADNLTGSQFNNTFAYGQRINCENSCATA